MNRSPTGGPRDTLIIRNSRAEQAVGPTACVQAVSVSVHRQTDGLRIKRVKVTHQVTHQVQAL